MAPTSTDAPGRRTANEASGPQRVVLVTNGLGCGGAEAQLLRLARMFVARGDEVGILSILPVVESSEVDGLAVPVAILDPGPVARAARAIRWPMVIICANVCGGVSVTSTVCRLGITRVWPRVNGRMSRIARWSSSS